MQLHTTVAPHVCSSRNQTDQLLRSIPSVAALLDAPELQQQMQSGVPRAVCVEAARAATESLRTRLLAHDDEDDGASREDQSRENQAREAMTASLISDILDRIGEASRPALVPLINGTGIIIHTGLGRAPLAPAIASHIADVAAGYAPVELDLESGSRGNRASVIRDRLVAITGCASATAVNNNAAALVIVLATLARQQNVVVSRGELIEIGGSFRLPDIMTAAGCMLREVGTTNRTRIEDYQRAIDNRTALILCVHPSNYRVRGFTASPAIAQLAELAHEHNLPFVHDIGSGLLKPSDHPALRHEPDVKSSLAAGADLVLFSGDKLLGGPQAGILLGRSDLISRIESHPLMRAMRLDKIILAALAATLDVYRDRKSARESLPILRMLHTTTAQLRARAEHIVAQLKSHERLVLAISETLAYAGGGSTPDEAMESIAVAARSQGVPADTLARQLRLTQPGVLGRVHHDAVLIDLRTVLPHQDDALVQALARCPRNADDE
ncbi:MAG: L-seryl-tRNA(Sec) selenium transferase [Phycisphaerales bacterium]